MFKRNLEKRKTFQGFTLAEVLITLAVIGVVAAITMPMLISNINERVNSERQANIVYKVTQAMEHMRALGKLTTYDSTESFVDELEKHLKITKRCDKDHIAECWPTNKILSDEGEELNVSSYKKGKDIHLKTSTNNVGLILADGASIILNYNNLTNPQDAYDAVQASTKSLPIGNNKTKEFTYTTSVTSGIDFIMDVNGKKGPNREKDKNNKYYDIRSFKAAGFSEPYEYGSAGKILFFGSSYDYVDCSDSSSAGHEYCINTTAAKDYWAGAQYTCAQKNMHLPSISELGNLNTAKSEYTSLSSVSGYFMSATEHPESWSDIPNMWISCMEYTPYENSTHPNGSVSSGLKTNIYRVVCVE